MKKRWLAILLAVTLTFQGGMPVTAADLQVFAGEDTLERMEEAEASKSEQDGPESDISTETTEKMEGEEQKEDTEAAEDEVTKDHMEGNNPDGSGSEEVKPGESSSEEQEPGEVNPKEDDSEEKKPGEVSPEETESEEMNPDSNGSEGKKPEEVISDDADSEGTESEEVTLEEDGQEKNEILASETKIKSSGQLLVHYDRDSFETSADGKVTGLKNQAADEKYEAKQDDPDHQPLYVEHSDFNNLPAMRLEDASYLQLGEDGGFDLTDMTMVAVLKPNKLEAQKSQICSRKKNGSGDHNWYWNVEDKTGLNYGWKKQGANEWCSPGSKPILAEGEEYVLIVRKDGSQGSVFVNGKETTFTGGETPEYNGENVYLGAPLGNSDGEVSINADICEFRIYDYALDQASCEALQKELSEKYLEDSAPLPDGELPEGVAGLQIWLDAADLQLKDQDKVAEWKNKVYPDQYHAAQKAADHQPTYVASSVLNGKPAVRLDKQLYLEVDKQLHPDDLSIFAVVCMDSLEGNSDENQILSKLGNRDPWNHNWYFNISGGGLNFGWKDEDGYHDYENPNRNLSTGVNYILGGVKKDSKGSLYINQVCIGDIYSGAADSAAFHNDTPVYIGGTGAGKSMTGVIGEVLVYDRGLTSEEAEKIQTYLGDKWGIEKAEDPASLTGSIFIDGEELRAFSPNTDTYRHTLPTGTTVIPQVTADFDKCGAIATVTQAADLPGEAVVTVQKGGTAKSYTIRFSVLDREVLDLKQPTIEEITITDGFWKDYMDLFQKETINHVFDNFERTGTLENFKNAGTSGASPDRRTDPWNDGLLFETIRGASDFLRKEPDEALKKRIDGYIDIVYQASLKSDNGYLSTWAMMERPGRYFDETGNARWYHDCYNFGCMAEAAVHCYKATGDTKLLYVATRFAEFLVDNYGYGTKADGTPKINMVPSHEGPEEMLLKLYELYRDTPGLKDQVNRHTTPEIGDLSIDEEEYKDLVAFWIENRGNYDNRINGVSYDVYAQDHQRYFDQEIAAGHAVRANLFYTGMAAAGLEFKDYTYLSSAENLWQNIVDKQMYITGGVGAQGADEAYGPNYDLPNDGYCETCAQVAMGFFSEYMGLAFGESKYADILENYIYNGVLGCVGQDGKSFYYQQPLTDKNRGRWEWIEHTPCCPPMFLKFYGELSTYIYAYNNQNVYVNQFISSRGTLGNGVTLEQETEMPWGGMTSLKVNGTSRIHIRIPDWADASNTVLQVNGQAVNLQLQDGYAVVDVNGSAMITLTLPMEARREYSHPEVSYNEGKVALTYGPLVYCVESTDHALVPEFNRGEGNVGLPVNTELYTQFEKDLLGGVQTITFEGQYYDSNGKLQTTKMKAIPFYARSNRGSSSTFVWIDETVSEKAGKNKRWLAHATSTRDNGNSAAAAFDGNKDTYWSAGSPELPQALMVDLGKETRISQVVTTFTSAQAWKYQVMYSRDGQNWEIYADRSINAVNQQEYVDEKLQEVRYVAVKFVESAGVGFISVKEVKVLDENGQNLALDKLCGSSSTSNVGESVFAVLDGEEKTRYCPPNEAKPQSLTMDMGQSADILGVDILFEKPTDWTYQIEISEDGKQWEPYFSETANLTEKKIEKEAVGRYVRFTITETTGGVWASAWEFDVRTRQELTDVFDVLFGRTKEQVTITAGAQEHGSISPSGEIVLEKGEDISFTVTPEEGYKVKQVLANGKALQQGQDGKYMLSNVQEDTVVVAEFEKIDAGTDRPSEGDGSSEGNQPSEGDQPSEGNKPSEGDQPSEGNKPSEGDRPSSGNGSSGGSHSSGGNDAGTGSNAPSSSVNGVSENGEIPPTGDNSPIGAALLGILLSLALAAVLMNLKRRNWKIK